MGLRLATQRLEAGLAALDSAVVELTVAANNVGPKKRALLLAVIKNLATEQSAIRHVLQRVHAVRERRSRVAAEECLDDELDVVAEIFAEAQNLRGSGGTPRESAGEAPPSWDDAVKGMEEREL